MATRILVGLALAAGCCVGDASAQGWDSKRGIAGGTIANANSLNARWFYQWSNNPPNGITNGSFNGEYVPMIWSANTGNINGNINDVLGYADDLNVKYVLGFNEPERGDQANMSVNNAIDVWKVMDQRFAGTGIKLVSPAVSDTAEGRAWISSFMNRAANQGLQVDAVAFHWYGSVNINNPQASANAFLSSVASYHNTFNRPIWITEFAGLDFGNNYTSAQIKQFNADFLELVIPELESRQYVERYAWWQYGLPNNGQSNDTALSTSNSVFTPTPIGDAYIPSYGTNETLYLNGKDPGKRIFYLRGGRLINPLGSAFKTVYSIDAIENTSQLGGAEDWEVTGGTVRVRTNATLEKIFAGTVTLRDLTLLNYGEFQVTSGTLELAKGVSYNGSYGSYRVANTGTLVVTGNAGGQTGTVTIEGNGTLTGNGRLGGAVDVFATFAPGTDDDPTATFNANSDFTFHASSLFKVDLIAANDHDQLVVGGTAELAGTLNLLRLDGFMPEQSDRFLILSAGQITGGFDQITGHTRLDGYIPFVLEQTSSQLWLTGAKDGDADADGDVDETDLEILLSRWGSSTSSWEQADFNGDGRSDALDLRAMLVNWGHGTDGSGITAEEALARVPEPGTGLALLAGGVLLLRRRSHRA